MKNFLFLSLICIGFLSCKDNRDDPEPEPNCGCNSEIEATIPKSANLIGSIRYKIQLAPNDNYYNNKFWITYTEPNCINCVHSMIVCNENILPQEILNIKNTGETLSVKFAGDLKTICEKIFAPGDYTYQNITLTNIEKQ